MTITKVKLAAGAVIVAGLGTAVVLEHEAGAKLRRQNESLRQQVGQWQQAAGQRERAAVASAGQAEALKQAQFQELGRLRQQAPALRPQTNELARVQAENRRLRYSVTAGEAAPPDEPETAAEAEFRKETQRRDGDLRQWGLMFQIYKSSNHDRFPGTWEQVADQVAPDGRGAFLNFATNTFEIVYRGGEAGLSNRWDTIVFRERLARRAPKGEWVKVYGLADGSTDIHVQPSGDFAAYEHEHIIGPE